MSGSVFGSSLASRRSQFRMAVAAVGVAAMCSGALAQVKYSWNYYPEKDSIIKCFPADSQIGTPTWGSATGAPDCGHSCMMGTFTGLGGMYRNVDTRKGLIGFGFTVSTPGTGKWEALYVGPPTGTPLCTLRLTATGTDWGAPYVKQVIGFAVPPVSGIQNLSVRQGGDGGVNVNSVTFVVWSPKKATEPTQWTPNGTLATGDSVVFAPTTQKRDTIQWDTQVLLSYMSMSQSSSNRFFAIRFDSLLAAGTDTLYLGHLSLSAGHVLLPAGFVLRVGSADTSAAAMPLAAGSYTTVGGSFSHPWSIKGGGTLIVGSLTSARSPIVGRSRITPHRAQPNAIGVGSRVETIALFSPNGTMVRSVGNTNAISIDNLTAGTYIMKTRSGTTTRSWSVVVGTR